MIRRAMASELQRVTPQTKDALSSATLVQVYKACVPPTVVTLALPAGDEKYWADCLSGRPFFLAIYSFTISSLYIPHMYLLCAGFEVVRVSGVATLEVLARAAPPRS